MIKVLARVRTYLSAKSLSSEGAQAAVLQAMNVRRAFDCQIYTPP